MNAAFPHRYQAEVRWIGGSRARILAGTRAELAGGPPPEFGGTPAEWSPEHLLLSAANLCLLTTFFAIAARARFEPQAYESSAEGVLDKTAEGLAFTKITLKVKLTAAPGQEQQAKELLLKAKRYCIVSNALKAPVVLQPEIVAGRPAVSA